MAKYLIILTRTISKVLYLVLSFRRNPFFLLHYLPKKDSYRTEKMGKFFLLLFILYSHLLAQTAITILHTNNINGTLENCLCTDHPLGSIEKIKAQVDSIRSKNKNVLFVDTGDFFSAFGDAQKDRISAQALQLMPYDFLALGDQEFSNGVDFFRNEIYNPQLPYISLNLKVDGIRQIPTFKIIRLDGINILITSVISPDAFRFYEKPKITSLQVADPIPLLEELLPQHSADFIVLLSHLGLEQDKIIARKFPEINLIIGGHSQDVLDKAEQIGQTIITQAGSDGCYLGKIELKFSKSRKLKTFKSELLPMSIHLPNDPQIAALARAYDFGFISNSIKHRQLPIPIAGQFLVRPADSCAGCHQKQFKSWRKSAHAHSWKSIQDKKKTKSAQCVACHVSGFGRLEGFINENLTPELKSVGCTDCHWTNPEHPQKKNKRTVKKIDAEVCQRCHDSVNDSDFNYEEDNEQIRH